MLLQLYCIRMQCAGARRVGFERSVEGWMVNKVAAKVADGQKVLRLGVQACSIPRSCGFLRRPAWAA